MDLFISFNVCELVMKHLCRFLIQSKESTNKMSEIIIIVDNHMTEPNNQASFVIIRTKDDNLFFLKKTILYFQKFI